MKRQNFDIFANGVLVGTKHKWNSANRVGMIEYVTEVAQKEGVTYFLDNALSEQVKEGFDFVSGKRVWKAGNGTTIVITIQKRAED